MLRLWIHLITMNDDRLTKLVFLWDLEKSNNQNWSHHDDVKRLLQFLDMSTWFFFKSWGLQPKLSQKFVNYWLNELQRVSKYRAYMSFRIDFRLEKYVTKDISKPYWSVLAQLRRAVLPISKETGAIQGEGVKDRLCTMCSVIKYEFDFNCTVHLIQTLEPNFYLRLAFNHRLLSMSDSDCTSFLSNCQTVVCRQSVLFENSNA